MQVCNYPFSEVMYALLLPQCKNQMDHIETDICYIWLAKKLKTNLTFFFTENWVTIFALREKNLQ